MKSQITKLMTIVIGIHFLFGASLLFASTQCDKKEKEKFKRLYLTLQQSLNYEGKDVEFLNKTGGDFKLVPHKKDAEHEGKIFERKLFLEYQNSLRKVGALYQAAKYGAANNPAHFKSNTALVDFVSAVDNGNDAKYIAGTNIDTVIDELQKASEAKYPADSKLRISKNDKYLLKKLLTHAQDRLCSVNKYNQTKKGVNGFSAELMEKTKNAPLNQLLLAVKDAKLTKDSDIKIVDTDVAINSAIQANINAISKWMNEASSGCKAAIASVAFKNEIQPGIQTCNYGEFIKSLTADTTDIEKILHFINSNEKFRKKVALKAETDLDEFKLQAYVDRAFANLGSKIHCSEVVNSNKSEKRLFVRNLPYLDDQNKFDTSKISCKVKVAASKKGPASERVLSEPECASKIELVSDDLGRGIEVKQKNSKEAPISFSIKDNPECNDLTLATDEEVTTPEPVVVTPPVVSGAVGMTLQMCIAEAKKINFPGVATLEANGTCKNTATDEECAKQKAGQIANLDKTGCMDKPEAKPEVKPEIVKKTKADCDKEDKDLDEEKNECIPRKKVEPTKPEETESEADKECRINNEKRSEDKGGISTDWQVKDGKCIDTKIKPSKSKDTVFEEEDAKPVRAEGKFTPPARFTPINIPTRQMYILPGMP